jgi:mannuronan 5-epimerase
MTIFKKNYVVNVVVAAFLIFSMIGISLFQKFHFSYGTACIDYDQTENTITISCNASFLDVASSISDQSVLEQLRNSGEYLLKASLQVDDDATFSMTSNDIKWLKIAGTNGIIVNGKIQVDGVRITSWDTEANSPVFQTITGSIPRAFINLRGSEGGFVHNSEIAYLGYQEFGRRGFDLFGGDEPAHNLDIRGSKFHDMWFAFYSSEAYNITVDGNEFYNNIKYALDPHSGTHDMNITNNWLHDNRIGAICSDQCYNIIIEGNMIQDTADAAIFFSRNMTDSIARNNHVYNASSGIDLAESPNNQIYNNTIEGATSEGVLLFNPEVVDDGFTANNHVYNNTISNSNDGFRASKSQDNLLENNIFSNIESSEYRLTGNSSIIIRGQDFDNALITQDGSATNKLVEIVDSGTIQVLEVNDGGGDGDNDGGQEQGKYYNTDNTPYRKRLSDGDSIIVNS